MAKELNEDSSFKVSIKTLVAIGFAMATVISMWFMLQADIRLTIQNTQDDVEEIKEDLKRIEEKIDRLK